MSTEPLIALQDSIRQLEHLCVLLAADLKPEHGPQLPPQMLMSKEALLTIRVLLPKLRAAHQQRVSEVRQGRVCFSCGE